MQIIRSLDSSKGISKPAALTIGNFDGMHLGHQAVLNRLKAVAKDVGCPCGVITFANHSFEILHPERPYSYLYSIPHKIRLLEEFGIDILILLKFTLELSQLTPEEFLRKIYAVVPFSHLVLGHDSAFGKGRQGDRQRVQAIVAALNSHVEYLDPLTLSGKLISSTAIRGLIHERKLDEAAELLGRPYSIYGEVMVSSTDPSTVTIDTTHLYLPPAGVYPVMLLCGAEAFPGTARIDSALEVTLVDTPHNLIGQMAEVVFQAMSVYPIH